MFTVRDVPVDATAESAAAARVGALAEAQRRALDILFSRLTLSVDREVLPALEAQEVAELVQAIEIANERTSAVRYLADVTVSFKRDAVRGILQVEGIPFAETVGKPVLVLPVYRAAGATLLWDDPNPWREAWLALDGARGLVPLVHAPGDLSDIAQLSARQALSGDLVRLETLARRHGAEDSVVALAGLGYDRASGLPTVTVSATRFSRTLGRQTVLQPQTYRLGDSLEMTLSALAGEIEEAIEDRWKESNLLRFDREEVLEVRVPVSGLREWVDIRSTLGRIAAVRRSDLVAFSPRQATVSLLYAGERDTLRFVLSQNELVLEDSGTGWVLRRAGTPVEPGGPAAADPASGGIAGPVTE